MVNLTFGSWEIGKLGDRENGGSEKILQLRHWEAGDAENWASGEVGHWEIRKVGK